MEKILVVSDTHGDISAAVQIAETLKDVSCIFHLGDNTRDAAALEQRTGLCVVNVRGNCDFDLDVPGERIVTRGGAKIMLVHGHQYQVGYSLLRLSLAAQEAGAQAVLFGHTHKPLCTYENGVLIVNPGSLSRPRGSAPCCAVLEIDDGLIYPRIIDADKMLGKKK